MTEDRDEGDRLMTYEKPVVQLTGEDGNAFSIMGRVRKALKDAGAPAGVIAQYQSEAMKGDYDHLLRTTMEYVDAR